MKKFYARFRTAIVMLAAVLGLSFVCTGGFAAAMTGGEGSNSVAALVLPGAGTGSNISVATLSAYVGETGMAAVALAPKDLVQATTSFKNDDELKIEAKANQNQEGLNQQSPGNDSWGGKVMAKDGLAGWEHVGNTDTVAYGAHNGTYKMAVQIGGSGLNEVGGVQI